MSVERVKNYLKQFGKENDVMEFSVSSATVSLAAEAVGVSPAMITKTLAFKEGDSCIVIGIAGDMKIDNRKFKDEFGIKAKMLSPEETLALTGYAVGGVCAFDLPLGIKSYLDVSLKRFEKVFPACGSSNSAIGLSPDELFNITNSVKWIDACKA